jgi:hypothetical protein
MMPMAEFVSQGEAPAASVFSASLAKLPMSSLTSKAYDLASAGSENDVAVSIPKQTIWSV